jgi:hypothetical protein
MLKRLKVAWFFINRWDDIIGMIVVSSIAFLFAFHMIRLPDTAMIVFLCARMVLCVIGIVGLLIAIFQMNKRT